ncbi:MAG: RNA polymerase sigma factor [Chloroflexota bacterium]|nr:RNA polymerase sigma factor [Chloroflexota bacterium]
MDSYEALVEQAQTGEQGAADAAFSALIDRFWMASVQWAYATLGDFDLAQDAAQEAFIAAHQSIGDLREARAFPAWLRRIVLSQCIRMTRRATPELRPLEEEDARTATDDPELIYDDHALHEGVRQAVRALPDHERSVTELFYLAGYSQQEIAESLELPLTTVKKRLQYARERLKSAQPLIEQFFNQMGGLPTDMPMLDDEQSDVMTMPMGILRSYVGM